MLKALLLVRGMESWKEVSSGPGYLVGMKVWLSEYRL